MRVPLLDLKAQYQSIKEEIAPVLEEICESQYFILGPRVEQLESRIAAYCECPHAVGVSSGSDALIISLMAAGTDSKSGTSWWFRTPAVSAETSW